MISLRPRYPIANVAHKRNGFIFIHDSSVISGIWVLAVNFLYLIAGTIHDAKFIGWKQNGKRRKMRSTLKRNTAIKSKIDPSTVIQSGENCKRIKNL
jgi:hypothetical protein